MINRIQIMIIIIIVGSSVGPARGDWPRPPRALKMSKPDLGVKLNSRC